MTTAKAKLTAADWRGAAWMLKCDPLVIQSVANVEAPKGGFLEDGQVRILFEAHVFARHTGGRFNTSHPTISSAKWSRKLYAGGAGEHTRLARAVGLDREAALKSASWGRFQILGQNYREAGFNSLQAFINAHHGEESDHLRAFVCFIRWDARLLAAVEAEDFTTFARVYNGPSYAANQYDVKMAAELRRLRAAPTAVA
jgi:hypothetical protein